MDESLSFSKSLPKFDNVYLSNCFKSIEKNILFKLPKQIWEVMLDLNWKKPSQNMEMKFLFGGRWNQCIRWTHPVWHFSSFF